MNLWKCLAQRVVQSGVWGTMISNDDGKFRWTILCTIEILRHKTGDEKQSLIHDPQKFSSTQTTLRTLSSLWWHGYDDFKLLDCTSAKSFSAGQGFQTGKTRKIQSLFRQGFQTRKIMKTQSLFRQRKTWKIQSLFRQGFQTEKNTKNQKSF